MPVTLIGESVFARCLSALKDERVAASKVLNGPPSSTYNGDKKEFVECIRQVSLVLPLLVKSCSFYEDD